jgi:hypothetical protein
MLVEEHVNRAHLVTDLASGWLGELIGGQDEEVSDAWLWSLDSIPQVAGEPCGLLS